MGNPDHFEKSFRWDKIPVNLKRFTRPAVLCLGLTGVALALSINFQFVAAQQGEKTPQPPEVKIGLCPGLLNPDRTLKIYQAINKKGQPEFNPKNGWGFTEEGYFYSIWLDPLFDGKLSNVVGLREKEWPRNVPPEARLFVWQPQIGVLDGESVWGIRRNNADLSFYINRECTERVEP